jgi:ABC-2 type transport system permease protein
MRWLFVKDLQILRRSPFLVALLVAYPVLIALLIGLALSKGPDKPRVAFLNQVPAEASDFAIGNERLDASKYANELFKAIEPVRVGSRAEALQKVRDGEALAALIVPADIVRKLQGAVNLAGLGDRPQVEVVYNVEDPVKAQFVESTIKARLADANKALSDNLTELAAGYLDLLLKGGTFSIFGRELKVLGLQRSQLIIDAALTRLPRGDPDRRNLEQVSRFSKLAVDNLDLAQPVLRTVGSPVQVKRTVLKGRATPLDAFAVSVAVAISLLFVTVLLGAGMLALEREEHTFTRLARGLVSRTGLIVEKVGLSALCALGVTLVMTMGIGAFVELRWDRFALWLVALAAGAVAFGAMGVAIGALAREVRAASLLAFLLALPIAFLALVPSGAVASALFDVIRVVSALFPFKPALQGIDAALNDADPGLGGSLAHLAALTIGWGALARVALARFA